MLFESYQKTRVTGDRTACGHAQDESKGHTHISHTQNRRGQEGSHTHTHGRCGMVMRLKYRHAWRLRWHAPHAVPAIHPMHQIENVRIVHGMNGAKAACPPPDLPTTPLPGLLGRKDVEV